MSGEGGDVGSCDLCDTGGSLNERKARRGLNISSTQFQSRKHGAPHSGWRLKLPRDQPVVGAQLQPSHVLVGVSKLRHE